MVRVPFHTLVVQSSGAESSYYHGPLGFMAVAHITLQRRQNGVVPVPSRGHSLT